MYLRIRLLCCTHENHPPVVVHRAGIGLLVIYTLGIAALVLDLLLALVVALVLYT